MLRQICTLDMINFCLLLKKNPSSKVMVAQNFIKNDLEIWFTYFRKLLRFWGQFSSNAFVQSNIWPRKCLETNAAVLENLSQNRDNFLKYIKKYF